jgi:hypothetical protein
MTADSPLRVDLNRMREIVLLIEQVREVQEHESIEITLNEIGDCSGEHQNWMQGIDRDGIGTGEYWCRDCGLTPELAFALDIELTMAGCGHCVYTARDYELLGHHVDADFLSETAGIWSCSMAMDDWGE